MIPASDILIDGDTAWLVMSRRAAWVGLNRPCDHCLDGSYPMWDRNDEEIECPDCDGTGRHWFDIDVQGYSYEMWVSVVEVLPIRSLMDSPVYPSITKTFRTHDGDTGTTYHDEDRHQSQINLPESAAPGHWAVRLRVKV